MEKIKNLLKFVNLGEVPDNVNWKISLPTSTPMESQNTKVDIYSEFGRIALHYNRKNINELVTLNEVMLSYSNDLPNLIKILNLTFGLLLTEDSCYLENNNLYIRGTCYFYVGVLPLKASDDTLRIKLEQSELLGLKFALDNTGSDLLKSYISSLRRLKDSIDSDWFINYQSVSLCEDKITFNITDGKTVVFFI